ncbi:MAG: MBOAT family protein, partial [Clostridiales bacterium]|nr:MBOAT family protein [Clostridiales bacterium]
EFLIIKLNQGKCGGLMVFSSQIFLFIFLPIVFILYSVIPNLRIKNFFLLLSSILFYAFGEPYAVILMLVSIVVNHFSALMICKSRHRKAVLTFNVIFNVGILFVFKYLSWIVNLATGSDTLNIALPIGISFFTFQSMSYVIDVYKEPSLVQKNLFNTALYISFFPQLIAGPIVKYHDINHQIESRKQSADKIVSGIKRFIVGLFKKVVISDTMAVIADISFENEEGFTLSSLCIAASAICYTLQIFFDFSGYSDMAIGLGKMFGFDFNENFNYPYSSSSMKEFWRRWHISLSTWFKEYVYIPLGGNRAGKVRTCLNKCIVFVLTGLWHGANFTFLVWGIIHGIFMMLEETKFSSFLKKSKILSHIYVLIVVVFSFIIFRADSLSQAFELISRLFIFGDSSSADSTSYMLSQFSPYVICVFVLALLMCVPLFKNIAEKVRNKSNKIYKAASFLIVGFMFIFDLITVITGEYSPFIYFQF